MLEHDSSGADETSALLRPAEASSRRFRVVGLSRVDRSLPPSVIYRDVPSDSSPTSVNVSEERCANAPADQPSNEEADFVELGSSALWVTTTRISLCDFAALRDAINAVDPDAIVSYQLESQVHVQKSNRSVDAADRASDEIGGDDAPGHVCRVSRRRRVFAASARLVAFSLEPLVPFAALRNIVTWRWWPIVFLSLWCVFEVGVLLSPSFAISEYYVTCMSLFAILLYVNISQYSRQTFVYCLKTFDFWYQFVNFAVFVAANAYADMQTYSYGCWVIVPHIFQAVAMSITVFAIDASFRLGPVTRSLIVCLYSLGILGVLIAWRVRLRKEHPELINVGFAQLELASVAESSAITCFIFGLRFGFNFVVRKLPTELIKFRLVEVTSPAEQLELERRCEFSIAFGTTDPEEQRQVVSETMSLLAVRIPRAEVYLVSPSLSRALQRCYTPKHCALSVDGTAFVQARWLEWLTAHRLWKWVHVVAVAGLVLGVAPIPTSDPELACRVGIQFVCGTVFALNISQYSRGVVRSVLKTFEFWFLIVQVAILCACNAYRAFSDAGWRHLPSCLFAWLLFFASALLQDGGNFSRRFKTIIRLEAAVIMGWAIASWGFFDTAVRDRALEFLEFRLSIGSLAQSSALTVLTYFLRHAYAAVMFGTDTVLWFNAVAVASQYARDAAVAESTMARSLTVCTAIASKRAIEPPLASASPLTAPPPVETMITATTRSQRSVSIASSRPRAATSASIIESATASFAIPPYDN
jgi:hypothetical protein